MQQGNGIQVWRPVPGAALDATGRLRATGLPGARGRVL